MKCESTVPEVSRIFKEIMQSPGKMFELLELDLRGIAQQSVNELLKVELTSYLGRDRYERAPEGSGNHRNGYSKKNFTVKNIGELKLSIPRDRNGEYESQLIQKYDRYDQRIEKDISLMFLSGLSTRGIELISKTLLGRKISRGEVSAVNEKLLSGLEVWRTRPLHEHRLKYMYIDGVNFHIRMDRHVEIIPMLIVVGVTRENRKMFLCIQQGTKDAASVWRQVFKDIKARGLDYKDITLGIMDGLPGLMTVFREEFPNAKVQRCQVHVARNVLSKITRGKKKEVADRLRDIFYAPKRTIAREMYEKFIEDYEQIFPSATKCLSNIINECLTFYSFPEEEWISLRTTNLIERVNKEFKRRTKPMEILAGEKSSYRLLCFVALKMELGWRSSPIGKKNLPVMNVFTQTT